MKQHKEKTWNQVLASRSQVKNPSKALLEQWFIENQYYTNSGELFKTQNSYWQDANGNQRRTVRRLY